MSELKAYLAVQDGAVGVVAEASAALERLDTASAVDERCDQVTLMALQAVRQVKAALAQGDRATAMSFARVAEQRLLDAISLDEAEEEHWRIVAPVHVQSARDEGQRLISWSEARRSAWQRERQPNTKAALACASTPEPHDLPPAA